MGWSEWKLTTLGWHGDFRPVGAPAAAGRGYTTVISQEDRNPYSGDYAENSYLGNDVWNTTYEHFGPPAAPTGSPALAATQDGDRLDLLVTAGSVLWHRSRQRPYGWTDWENLDGGEVLASGPAVCAEDDQIDVFAISGRDLSMLHRQWRGAWSPWTSLGGRFRRLTPAASTWGAGRIGVFAVGQDYGTHHKWSNGGGAGFSEWENLGGVTERGIAACSWGWARTDLFHRGQDRAVYHRWFDGRWSEWENMGGATDSGITVASPGLNRLLLLHVGLDRNIYYREF